MKKIVFLTGAGMSAESGISTFRDSDGLWEKYPVEAVQAYRATNETPCSYRTSTTHAATNCSARSLTVAMSSSPPWRKTSM